MSIYVRTVRAHEGETVEIQWRLEDGSVYIERYTVPPKAVREARSPEPPPTFTDADVERYQQQGGRLVSWGDVREKSG